MTRTKLADRKLPDYTKGEEIANMVTHIAGAVFGVVALVLCVVRAALGHNGYRIVGAAIYGASMLFLYTMSSVYHGMPAGMGKKVMQVLDHCSIYLLIGGTYTPIVLGPIREMSPAIGWTLFGVVWGIGIIAAVFTAIDHHKFRKLSMACYILMGWTIVFAVKPTVEAITRTGLRYLLGGGVAYTIGAVLYGVGKKMRIRYMHTLFHVFVLAGTVLHFITVYRFCV
ncbi:MAG: PAQR family membrane homeostasis protein TrhA [Christensenellales bacterium]